MEPFLADLPDEKLFCISTDKILSEDIAGRITNNGINSLKQDALLMVRRWNVPYVILSRPIKLFKSCRFCM